MHEHIFLFCNIEKYCQKHLSNWFFLISGIWNVIFSVITLPVLSNRVLTSPLSMSTFTVLMLISSSLITVSAVWFRLSAVAITQESSQWNDMRLIAKKTILYKYWRNFKYNFYDNNSRNKIDFPFRFPFIWGMVFELHLRISMGIGLRVRVIFSKTIVNWPYKTITSLTRYLKL